MTATRIDPATLRALAVELWARADEIERQQHITGVQCFDDILNEVAVYTGVPASDIGKRTRTGRISLARQITMYLARQETSLSWGQLGKAINRDHSTAIHGYHQIAKQVRDKPAFAAEMAAIRKRIQRARATGAGHALKGTEAPPEPSSENGALIGGGAAAQGTEPAAD